MNNEGFELLDEDHLDENEVIPTNRFLQSQAIEEIEAAIDIGGAQLILTSNLEDETVADKEDNYGFNFDISTLKADSLAGLTLSLVNLPMSMAFASAAGLDPTYGIISVFYSAFAIIISDSKYCIVSTSMVVSLLTRSIRDRSGHEAAIYCLCFSSLLLLIVLYTKIYRFMIIIPKCVMDGFLYGSVFSVFISQLQKITTIKIEIEPGATLFTKIIKSIATVALNFHEINPTAVVVYIIVTLSLFLLMKFWPSRPWVIVISIVSLLIGILQHYILPSQLNVELIVEEYPTLEFKLLRIPELRINKIGELMSTSQFYLDSLSLTLIILLDSSITWGMMSIVTDQSYLSRTRNIFVLVVSNMSTILTSGMGSTFAYARSMFSYQNGAKSKLACLMGGLFTLLIGYGGYSLFSLMPSVALEGILMGLELKIIRIEELKYTFKHDYKLFLTTNVVFISMLFIQPSKAIFLGLFVYLSFFAKQFLVPQSEVNLTKAKIIEDGSLVDSSRRYNT